MASRGDGMYLQGKTWWLDFRQNGIRRVVPVGEGISWSVAGELGSVKGAGILKREAGIGRKRKDLPFDKAKRDFLICNPGRCQVFQLVPADCNQASGGTGMVYTAKTFLEDLIRKGCGARSGDTGGAA